MTKVFKKDDKGSAVVQRKGKELDAKKLPISSCYNLKYGDLKIEKYWNDPIMSIFFKHSTKERLKMVRNRKNFNQLITTMILWKKHFDKNNKSQATVSESLQDLQEIVTSSLNNNWSLRNSNSKSEKQLEANSKTNFDSIIFYYGQFYCLLYQFDKDYKNSKISKK